MSKVGLVTFFHSNYGSVLQGYATKTFLQKNGYEPVLIMKDTFGEDEADIEANRKKHPEFMEDFQKFMASLSGNNAIVSDASMAQIDSFVQNELKPTPFSLAQLRELAEGDGFSAFIAGSDQVWNCTLGMLSPLFFLLFAPPKKRIALCPSFGATNVPAYLRDDLKTVLNEYETLSAREEEGVAIIKDITGRDAARLADPTLLLTPEEWRKFAGVSDSDDTGYLLLHFLNAPNPVAMKNIRFLADQTGLPVKCFATRHNEFSDIEGIELVDGGARDYVRTIHNAGLVCTDSFHTTMFSINLGTDFYSFDRQYVHGVSQISRITTVLNRYGLMERLILNEEDTLDLEQLRITTDCTATKDAERQAIQSYILNELKRVTA